MVHDQQREWSGAGGPEDSGFQRMPVCAGHHHHLFVEPPIQRTLLRLRHAGKDK